ncbi:GntR family transcriptional regulator [Nocardiopsis sp. YSL2]|uniref:GntR family transcriptional regulator n=1 Tax=Nocardiopsis sp. YSL2 TaxID=2939492 RepID=UPI0026F40FF1|nr:GntR family transcriptional regulator [Nocardiopsis sp. YSL2]
MTKWSGTPMYLTIAQEYRKRIVQGELEPEDKLPSEAELMSEFEVSRVVARRAVDVLRNEGLVVSHPGKGSFVKKIEKITRDSSNRYSRRKAGSTSPFKRDAAKTGKTADWEHVSSRERASQTIAKRLGIAANDPVMRTAYRFFSESQPIQVSDSWEPLALTGGTSVELPEDGAATGVVARMDLIGQHVDSVTEKVTARAALPEEAQRLELPAHSAYVLVIERTHYVGDQPVETCDIIFPGDRYELTYRLPVT